MHKGIVEASIAMGFVADAYRHRQRRAEARSIYSEEP